MIKTRKDLNFYLKEDYKMNNVSKYTGLKGFIKRKLNVYDDYIWKYIKLLRITEYFYNNKKNIFYSLMYIIHRYRRDKLGIRLCIEIKENVFGYGLTIYHFGPIVVNGASKVGNYCKIHGDNCIGNNGKIDNKCPVIGDDVDIGVGAKIIGDIVLADGIKIGAGSIVTKSFLTEGVTVCGVPGRELRKNI